MRVICDAAKDTENQRKHGVPLTDAKLMDWDAALIWQGTRRNYGETRMIALGAPLKIQTPSRCCVAQ